MTKVEINRVDGGYIIKFSDIIHNLREFERLKEMDTSFSYQWLRMMANLAGSSDKTIVCQNFEETIKKLRELFGES